MVTGYRYPDTKVRCKHYIVSVPENIGQGPVVQGPIKLKSWVNMNFDSITNQ